MSAPRRLELWFDFSCPYAYLGFTQAAALASSVGAELQLEPMLLGGVFRAREVPQNLSGSLSAEKAAHNAADLRRYAALFDVPLVMPAGHPIRTVNALRALLAVGPPFHPLAEAFFRAYWVDGIDLSKPEGVAQVLSNVGHDHEPVMRRASTDEVKDELRQRTDRAIEKGVFGAPAFFVDEVLYWGQDRLDEVRLALGGEVPPERSFDPTLDAATAPTELYFDYASPFAYLAVQRARALFGPALRLRPVRLSAVLSAVNGRPERPFMNQAKSDFYRADLLRQAVRYGIPLGAEPWRAVDSGPALAMTHRLLGAGAKAAAEAFTQAVFVAHYASGQDIEDPAVLAGLAGDIGPDAGRLAPGPSGPSEDSVSQATREALELGVFGVPTFAVYPPGRAPSLYFGHDRLGLALRAARGDSRLY